MWLSSSILYWASAGVVGYTYLGYPLGIHLLSRLRPRKVRTGDIEPTVSVVLCAHNEEAQVGRKLENLLSLDYPAHKLQVVVVSDGSSDGTDDVVRGFVERGVVLERQQRPSGKAQAINRGVARASGEIVLFCDTRQRISEDALRAMVPLFADPKVGAVSGELMIEGDAGPGAYWKYEKLIRAAEARLDSVVGATGALYAIRRHLFQPLPPDCLLDDVYTPMQVVLQGYRVVFQPLARAFDHEATLAGEFARKARTLAGNFQLMSQLPELLDPRKNRVFSQFFSHKVLRLACPVALSTLLASNVVLVVTGAPGWPLYALTLAGQVTVYGLAAHGALRKENAGKLSRLSKTFVVLNAAAVEGFRRYLRGDFTWTTERKTT